MRPLRTVCFAALLGASMALGGARNVEAQDTAAPSTADDAQAEARTLFERGVAALQRSEWAEAEGLLRASLAKVPRMATAYNLATALESQERLEAAVQTLEWILGGQFGAVDPVAQVDARDRIARLRARLARVTVLLVEPSTASVSVVGSSAPSARVSGTAELPMDPGDRLLVVDAEGYASERITLKLAPSEARSVEVRLRPLPGTLRVRTKPPGELITVGALGSFRSPFERALPPGTYEVFLTGHEETRRSVDVARDKTVELTLKLPEEDNSTTWWLVGGGAALAVAATVATILIVTAPKKSPESSPYFGTITALGTR